MEENLEAGYYIIVPYTKKDKEAAFELTVYSPNTNIELDVAGNDLLKKSHARVKSVVDKVFNISFRLVTIIYLSLAADLLTKILVIWYLTIDWE